MFTLATRPKHQFPLPVTLPADGTPSHCSQSERTCHLCRIVKVTVHPKTGDAWRAWRRPGEAGQLSDDFRPECMPVAQDVAGQGAKAEAAT